MAIQEQVMSLSFGSGLDTKTDPKQIDAGKLLVLENAVFINPKEIRKRNGYSSLPTTRYGNGGATILVGNSLGSLNNVLTLTDNDALYSYLPDLNAWSSSGLKPNTRISTSSLVGSAGSTTNPSECSALQNLKIVAYASPDNSSVLSIVLSDFTTNTVTVSNFVTLASPVTYIQTSIFNNNFIVSVISGNNIVVYSVAPTGTMLRVLIIPIFTSGIYNPIFSMINNSTNIYYLYVNPTGNILTVAEYGTAFTLVNTYAFPTTTSLLSADLFLDSINSELIAAYSYINNFSYQRLDLNLNALGFPFNYNLPNINSITISPDPTRTDMVVISEVLSTDGVNFYNYDFLVGAYRGPTPNIVNSQTFAYNTRLYSKVKEINGSYYYAVTSSDVDQPINFLIKYNSPFTVQSVSGAITVAGKFALNTALSNAPVGLVQWNSTMLPYLSANHATILNGTITALYQVSEMNLTLDQKLSNVTLGNNINYVGGAASLYDGRAVAEIGFNLFPKMLSIGNSGSGMTFSYVAIYTWIDFEGNLHRSAPSLPQMTLRSTDIDSGHTVAVTVTGLGLGELYKLMNVKIELYRTTNGGTTYYLTSVFNNNQTGTVTITDSTDSSSLQGNQQLYTTGGEVENIGPPPTNLMTSFKNRIILIDAENPLQWWFSKQIIQSFPAEFSDLLVQNIDQKGGPITALSTMDDKLVFFKESNIWYVIGDGPSPNGQNNDFTYPQIISSDTGCINQSSIVLTPSGLFFQSPKGIYLLGRDLSLNYIGAPVEQYNSSTVTSAQMIAGTNQIRFSLNSGITLVFDYFVQQWSVFTNISAVDSIIYKSNYSYLTSAGVVNVETPGAFVDPLNTIISLSLKTGWLSAAGLQGFERVKQFLVLGESESSTTLSVNLCYDFDSNIRQTDLIPIAGGNIPIQYRVFMQRQKCQSIQISLSDTPATPTEGLRLSALALNIGNKKGPYKKAAAVTYG